MEMLIKGLIGLGLGLFYAILGYAATPDGEGFHLKKFLRSTLLGMGIALGLPLTGMDGGYIGTALSTAGGVYLIENTLKSVYRRG